MHCGGGIQARTSVQVPASSNTAKSGLFEYFLSVANRLHHCMNAQGLWLIGAKGSTELPFMDAMPAGGVFDYERILFDGARGSKMLMVGVRGHRIAPQFKHL
eukprot:SAG31_NODE_578_length_13949_cov_5.041372_6_plen_102_part_00